MNKAIACLIMTACGPLAVSLPSGFAQVAERSSDGGKIILHDAQGTERAEVSLAHDATTIQLSDAEGKERIHLRLDGEGLQVEMIGVNSRPRAEFSFGSGDVDLGLFVTRQTIVGEMSVEENGNFLILRAPGGPEQAHISIGPQECHVVLMDSMGQPRIEFAIDTAAAFCHFIEPEPQEEEEGAGEAGESDEEDGEEPSEEVEVEVP